MMIGFPCRRCGLTLAILLALAGTAHADTLSDMATLRADFASPEIPVNEALIDQGGGGANTATIDQGIDAGGKGHYAEINQNGSSNQANVVQAGDSNRARIDQTGASNFADVTQTGTGNSVDITQDGNANLTTSQIGDYNSIVANMTNQNGMPATMSETGNNNSITANLSSPGLNVNINIVGNGMTVTAQ